jgi:hypothetical protein
MKIICNLSDAVMNIGIAGNLSQYAEIRLNQTPGLS